MTNPKEYTKAEIASLSDAELEKFAKNLPWPAAYRYSGKANHKPYHKPYKTKGYLKVLGGTKIASRRQYLVLRLQRSSQAKWNPGIKALVDARKAEEARLDALKPKVNVKVRATVTVQLRDCRKGGRSFNIWREGDKVVCQQDAKGGGSVGASVCSAKSKFSLTDFEAAVEYAKVLAALPTPAGSLKVNRTIQLGTDQPLDLVGQGDKVLISQHDRYGGRYESSSATKWHFNHSDLVDVIAALKKQYTYKLIEKENS